ncbi:MAG: glycosyltransferase family 4 protein [Deltaproteobacteria bacterium]|nr:glycosyltransferase family 4 protein [Candidatus Anaeroferrophillus wilburensis]MBN2889051.1 glycosyltransferase family 4 protein [Deltaproteobacteria bacterium]
MADKTYKLAFVVSLYFEYGGMQRTMLRIALECARQGHQVDIYTGKWLGKRPEKIGIHEVNTWSLTNHGSNDKLARTFKRETMNNCYDCLVGFTKIPGLDVYYAGDPCYAARVEETKGFLFTLSPRHRAFRRQEEAVFSRGSGTEFLLIAHQEQDKFIRYYQSYPGCFHLLPPGINRERLLSSKPRPGEIQALRQTLGIAPGEIMLLFIGSRFRTKGLDRALLAVASLPAAWSKKIRLVVVGDDKQSAYRRQANSLGLGDRVVFAGSQADMGSYYYSADVLLHPPYVENTGTVLLEAMVCGLPVLTTANCGFAAHIVEAGAGVVCPEPFDQQDLNRRLAEMVASGEKEQWRRNGIAYCEKHDLYSLIEAASRIIVARAAKNREDREKQ